MKILIAAGSAVTFGCVLFAWPSSETRAEGVDRSTVVVAADESFWRDRWRHPRRRGPDPVHMTPDDLEGTIWFSEEPHRRVTVTFDGDIEVKEGKEIYVHFRERIDDIFVIDVRWWNEDANIHVLEHGVLTRIEGNQYRYTESDHDASCDRGEFPGIIGRGTFELLSEGHAELIQIGHLIDGSASGFTAFVQRVDDFPPLPSIDLTYPQPCP